jgi:hypothetical protein
MIRGIDLFAIFVKRLSKNRRVIALAERVKKRIVHVSNGKWRQTQTGDKCCDRVLENMRWQVVVARLEGYDRRRR